MLVKRDAVQPLHGPLCPRREVFVPASDCKRRCSAAARTRRPCRRSDGKNVPIVVFLFPGEATSDSAAWCICCNRRPWPDGNAKESFASPQDPGCSSAFCADDGRWFLGAAAAARCLSGFLSAICKGCTAAGDAARKRSQIFVVSAQSWLETPSMAKFVQCPAGVSQCVTVLRITIPRRPNVEHASPALPAGRCQLEIRAYGFEPPARPVFCFCSSAGKHSGSFAVLLQVLGP